MCVSAYREIETEGARERERERVNVELSTVRQYNVTAAAFVAYTLVHCNRMQLIRASAIERTNYTFRYICRGTRLISEETKRALAKN